MEAIAGRLPTRTMRGLRGFSRAHLPSAEAVSPRQDGLSAAACAPAAALDRDTTVATGVKVTGRVGSVATRASAAATAAVLSASLSRPVDITPTASPPTATTATASRSQRRRPGEGQKNPNSGCTYWDMGAAIS